MQEGRKRIKRVEEGQRPERRMEGHDKRDR